MGGIYYSANRMVDAVFIINKSIILEHEKAACPLAAVALPGNSSCL